MNSRLIVSLLLLIVLVSPTFGLRSAYPRIEKKAGGRPLNLVPAAMVQAEGTQQAWPNSIFYKGKRRVDMNPSGSQGRYWIRHFHQPVHDILASNLDSWDSDPFGYDPAAPLPSGLLKK